MTPEAALTVEDLVVEVATARGWVVVVDGVDLTIGAGRTLGLAGESGSGKTLTSLAVMGLLRPRQARVVRGSVRLFGEELVGRTSRSLESIRGARMSMVFQEPMTALNPAFTIGEQVAEVLRKHAGVSRRAAALRAVDELHHVGIDDPARRARAYPHELSGGMRQRAMIAMAIACRPQLLIADEPTTALDVTVQAQVIDLLKSLRDELGLSLLFVTHNLGVVADICDDVAVMYSGQLVEQAGVDQLFDAPLHPYTKALLKAVPRIGEGRGKLSSLPAAVPMATDFPGCRFIARCPHAHTVCEAPVALRVDPSQHQFRCVRAEAIAADTRHG